jgi:hypothetical protein
LPSERRRRSTIPLLELVQALGEQRGRHQRHSALDVVEAAAAGEGELADHERRPALGEHLGRLCDGAELTVVIARSRRDDFAPANKQARGESCTSSRSTRYPTRRRSGAGSYLPEGTELPIVAPSSDGTRGVCVFESDSVDTVKNLVEGATGAISSNEYYAINEGTAMGLPA